MQNEITQPDILNPLFHGIQSLKTPISVMFTFVPRDLGFI